MRAHQMCMLLAMLCCTADSKKLILENNLNYTIWVGSQGTRSNPPIENGGWQMDAETQREIDVPEDYAGRVWARTGCNFDADGNGPCETGDCGGLLLCGGNGVQPLTPPATFAEFTFTDDNGQDTYDISVVGGYNLPVTMAPINNIGESEMYHCAAAACPSNAVNPECPPDLQVVDGVRIVGCKSSCVAFDNDLHCCRFEFGEAHKCVPASWPNNHGWFNESCPYYSYAFDDLNNTVRCEGTDFKITFG